MSATHERASINLLELASSSSVVRMELWKEDVAGAVADMGCVGVSAMVALGSCAVGRPAVSGVVGAVPALSGVVAFVLSATVLSPPPSLMPPPSPAGRKGTEGAVEAAGAGATGAGAAGMPGAGAIAGGGAIGEGGATGTDGADGVTLETGGTPGAAGMGGGGGVPPRLGGGGGLLIRIKLLLVIRFRKLEASWQGKECKR